MADCLTAIINLVKYSQIEVENNNSGPNRINNVGKGLEKYVENLFSGSFGLNDDEREALCNRTFSFRGQQNHPPDFILRDGPAIEVKKIESMSKTIHLNSSHPHDRLYSDDPRITKECRNCEQWTEKDLIYIIGIVNKKGFLTQLCIVYGSEIAAERSVYERVEKMVKTGIMNIENISIHETNELSRIEDIDPRNTTVLRVRGLWELENPMITFGHLYKPDTNKQFNMMALINENNYNRMDSEVRSKFETMVYSCDSLEMTSVSVSDPDDLSKNIPCRLITYSF